MSDYRISYVTPDINIVDGRLTGYSPEQLQRIVNYKALAFQRDRNLSALSYEIKRTRAVFDPGLGPSGGFRCPVGTRYGGQITDRFGRGCGWGVARRLINTVVDTGERLEEIGDRRRGRRVERRNRRVGARIGKPVAGNPSGITGGRIDRAAQGADRFAGRARRFAQRMDGNAGRPRSQRRGGNITGGRVDRAAGGAERFADRARRLARRMDGNSGRANRRQPDITGGRVDRAAQGADRFADRARRFAERVAGPGAGGRRRSERNEVNAPVAPPVGRRRRTTAISDAVSSRPRPARPRTEPAVVVRRPNVRQQGGRIDVDNLDTGRRERLDVLIGRERDRVNDFWDRRIEGEVTAEKIQQFVDERAERSDVRWRNTVAARKREWEILNSDNAAERVNELGPTARKRIADGLDDPSAPRPVKKAAKKRPAKKAAAKRPAKKAAKKRPAKKAAKKRPAKKAPAKKAAASRNQSGPANPEEPGAPSTPDSQNASDATPDLGKPRRLGRDRLRRRNKGTEAKLGRFDANGFADPTRVEVGNKGMDTQTKANKHVKDGGDLVDVPDDFLEGAIRSNAGQGKRFRIDSQAASANAPLLVTDTVTGQRLMVKKYRTNAIGFHEDMNEIIGLNIQERFGFLNGAMRFASPLNGDPNDPKTSAAIVVELGQNMLGDRLDTPIINLAETDDLLRLTLLDFAIINSDRHGGNFFTVRQDGKVRVYPIDPSLGFDARKGPGGMFPGTGDAAGFRQWLRHPQGGQRNNVRNMLAGRAGSQRSEMIAEIQKIQRELRKAERQEKASDMITRFQGIFPGRRYATDAGRDHRNAAKRLRYLMNANAEDLLDLIVGG